MDLLRADNGDYRSGNGLTKGYNFSEMSRLYLKKQMIHYCWEKCCRTQNTERLKVNTKRQRRLPFGYRYSLLGGQWMAISHPPRRRTETLNEHAKIECVSTVGSNNGIDYAK